jgi:TonB family protein
MLRLGLGIGVVLLAGSALGAILAPHAPPAVRWAKPVNLDPDSAIFLIPPGAPSGAGPAKPAAPADPKAQKVTELLERAQQLDLKGDFPGATAAMDQAFAVDPKNAAILAARAYVDLQIGDMARAIRDIDAAAKLNPSDTVVRSARATLAMVNGQSQDAMDIVNGLIREYPDQAQFFELRARVHAEQQNMEQALADLGEALRLEPELTQLHFERAAVFMAMYNWKGALDEVDQFLAQMPDGTLARNIRAYALSGVGRKDEALAEFDKVIAAQPTAEAYYGRAWARLPGDMGQVMADLDTALKINPDLAGAHRLKGQLYHDMGNYSAALGPLGNAVRLMPRDVSAARMLAAAYSGLHQYDAAIRQLDQAAVNHPDVVVLMDRCRYKALKKANLDDTLADCDRAAKYDPLSDEVREAKAFAYQRFGQTGKASDVYDDILTRRPNSAIVHFSRAVMNVELHAPDKARADFIAARKEDPTIDLRVQPYLKAPDGYEATNSQMAALLAKAKDASADGAHKNTYNSRVKWKPVSIVSPRYPSAAEDDQIQGYVDFEFVIQPDGSVGDPVIQTEMPEAYGLADAAVKVFPLWKFTPENVNGSPVPTKAFYRFSFKLR